MTMELDVLLGDALVGRVRDDERGRLRFAYDERWRAGARAYPLSVSMPLTIPEHGGGAVAAYVWGLLPDNEMILDAWARRFQVSARSPLALLAHVGEDCPGAVRFVAPSPRERLPREGEGRVDWLDEAAIAVRLRILAKDVSAWRSIDDAGQFSLGGAQPKTALFFDGKRWGVPSGRIPTTHILKPGAPELAGHAVNEHFCLTLAAECGLPVASSRILRFEDQVAIVLERYDRLRDGKVVRRVHQEDCCQALGVLPANKYESGGGPGMRAIATLLRERSRDAAEDVSTFASALAFNWLVAGTDGHAKNYSVLIGQGGEIRLAPLYDVASFLPYAGHAQRKMKLAMKIGGKYRVHEIGAYQWKKTASEIALDPEGMVARIAEMASALPDRAADVLRRTKKEGIRSPVVAKLAREIQSRARACARQLA